MRGDGKGSGRRLRAAALATAVALASLGAPALGASVHEAKLEQVLAALERGETAKALAQVERLTADYPNFRVAQLLYADLLLASAGRDMDFERLRKRYGVRAERLVEEAAVQIGAMRRAAPTAPPAAPYVIKPRRAEHKLVLVDAAAQRLYLMRAAGEGFVVERDFYVSVGKKGMNKAEIGDYKTPIGVYQIVGPVPQYRLKPVHGPRAFALDYPNELDRAEGRTGYSIWVHGVPDEVLRQPPRATSGCIVLANADLAEFERWIGGDLATITVAEEHEVPPPAARARMRQEVERAVETWRTAWEEGSVLTLGTLYEAAGTGRKSAQRPVAAEAPRVMPVAHAPRLRTTRVADLGLIRYPGRANVVVATFDEVTLERGAKSVATRRQVWRHDGASWRIAGESVTPVKLYE